MDRSDVLIEMADGRAALKLTLAGLSERDMEERVNGDWTRRDVLAHLEAWERRAAAMYDSLRVGRDPDYVEEGGLGDALNDRIFEENRSRSLADVRRGETEAYEALVRAVETAPEADLFDPDRFAWTHGRPFAEWILGNSSGHYDDHADQLAPRVALRRSA